MYTEAMKMAFHSIPAPQNFGVRLEDNDTFLTIRAKEDIFMRLSGDEKILAIEYMIRVKKALEDNGAIVLLVREGGKDE
jgi:hypothetical protein